MSRFDDAVLDLLAHAPGASTIDGLRARNRRRHRRNVVTITAIVAAVSVGSIGVAASLGRNGSTPKVSVSPSPASSTPVDTTWCVGFSRTQAIARGISYGTVIITDPDAQAKLVSRAELEVAGNPFGTSDASRIATRDKFWVIELRPSAKSESGPYKWGTVALDANTGEVVTANEGPAPEPPYWSKLPDHGSECVVAPGPTTATTSSTATTTTLNAHGLCPLGQDCLNGRPPTATIPCPADQSAPSFNGTFCGPPPGHGNGLGPQGQCNGQETSPPCGAGMIPGKYYEYTLPGACDGRLILDGRHWISELPPPTPIPPMNVWVSVNGNHAGFISPNGAVGFDLDHGQSTPSCTSQ